MDLSFLKRNNNWNVFSRELPPCQRRKISVSACGTLGNVTLSQGTTLRKCVRVVLLPNIKYEEVEITLEDSSFASRLNPVCFSPNLRYLILLNPSISISLLFSRRISPIPRSYSNMSATTASSLRASLRKQLMLLRHGECQLKSSSIHIRCNSNKPTLNNSTSTTSTTATAPRNPRNPPKPARPIPVPNTVAPLPFWQQLGPLTRVAEAYGHSQRKRPYLTQFFSTVAIYLAADISAQRMSGNEHDLLRTVRSLTIGGLASIPSFKWCAGAAVLS